MRFSKMILGLCSVGAISAAALAGCGSSGGNTGGSGGDTSSSSSSSGDVSSSSSGGGSCSAACCPGASCKAADKGCIGLVDNTAQTKFGLRMAELDITTPPALSTGLVASVVAGAVAANSPECNLTGTATFNWLLQFDTASSTLRTGGAKPVSDPASGYDFVDEMVTQGSNTFHIAPITFDSVKPDASGSFTVTTGQDLYVPIYLDANGSQVVILPLKDARLSMGTLSASQNCIGKFNADGLDPANSCLPDAQTPAFVSGASLDGLITLEDADGVIVSSLMSSLCVVLSGNPSMYGQNGSDGVKYCKRDSNNAILYQGDTCSTAGGTCKDAVTLGAKFAASSVKINN